MSIIHRGVKYLKCNSMLDVVRKCIYSGINYLSTVNHLFRKIRFFFFTKCWVKAINGRVQLIGIGNNIKMGKDITLNGGAIFEMGELAKLSIGSNFTLAYGSLIACRASITIGDNVMIGEYSSIRDTSHVYSAIGVAYKLQADKSEPIIIGDNVWIGRGCIVLPGTVIQDDVIVAANSIIKGILEQGCIYGGAPIKFIKRITE